MGGGRTSQTQTQTTNLPEGQQRNVDTLLSGALDFFNSGGRSFFPGDINADFNPNQIAGQNALVNFAGGLGTDLSTEAINANRFFMDINNLDPTNVPGFQGSVDDITRGFTQNLTENILPNVRGGGTATGQFGGSATGIGEALAVERSNAGLSDSLSNLTFQSYLSGLDSFNQALNRAPQMFGLGAAPGTLVGQVGDIQQGQAQREIDADVARHNFGQNEPIAMLELLRSLTGQSGEFGGTTTGTVSQSGGGGIGNILGGALSLASLFGGQGGGGGKGGGGGGGSANFGGFSTLN
jgi:hypothetical protein